MARTKALILIAVIALAVTQVSAAATETKNDLGVVVGYIDPLSDSTISGVKFETDSAVDYGIAYKHRFLESGRLSVGGTLLFAQFDIKAAGTKVATIDNMPLLVDANWHFLANKNLYAGVTVGYAFWGDVKPEGGGPSVKTK